MNKLTKLMLASAMMITSGFAGEGTGDVPSEGWIKIDARTITGTMDWNPHGTVTIGARHILDATDAHITNYGNFVKDSSTGDESAVVMVSNEGTPEEPLYTFVNGCRLISLPETDWGDINEIAGYDVVFGLEIGTIGEGITFIDGDGKNVDDVIRTPVLDLDAAADVLQEWVTSQSMIVINLCSANPLIKEVSLRIKTAHWDSIPSLALSNCGTENCPYVPKSVILNNYKGSEGGTLLNRVTVPLLCEGECEVLKPSGLINDPTDDVILNSTVCAGKNASITIGGNDGGIFQVAKSMTMKSRSKLVVSSDTKVVLAKNAKLRL